MENEAYTQGYDAYCDGASYLDNPYINEDSDRSQQWDLGFYEAECDESVEEE